MSIISRLFQGIGSAISATITYSLAVFLSEKDGVKQNIGLLELSSSIGLSAIPVASTFIYHFLGYSFPLYIISFFKLLCILAARKLKFFDSQCKKSNFCKVIFKWRIFLSFLSIVIVLSSVNFFYPVFANHLTQKFNLSLEISSVFFVIQILSYFFMISFIGVFTSLFGVKLTMSFGLFFNFLFVFFLIPAPFLPQSLVVVVVGLVILGLDEALITIPSVEDFISTLTDELKTEKETANDLSSALYNLGINVGDSIGPIFGGYLTEISDFEHTCFFFSVFNIVLFSIFILSSLVIIKRQLILLFNEVDPEERNTFDIVGSKLIRDDNDYNSKTLEIKRKLILGKDHFEQKDIRLTHQTKIGKRFGSFSSRGKE